MSHKGFIVIRVLASILLICALAVGGYLLFRAGEAQGYAQGIANAASAPNAAQGANPAPGAVAPYGYHGFGMRAYPFFFPFFPLGFLGFAAFFFFLFIVGGFFRMIFGFGHRRMWREHEWGEWHQHMHQHWGGEPPAGPTSGSTPKEPPSA